MDIPPAPLAICEAPAEATGKFLRRVLCFVPAWSLDQMQSRMGLALAVVVAGALIGGGLFAGLYFGLRAGHAAEQAPVPPPAPPSREAAYPAAVQALDRIRPDIVAQCGATVKAKMVITFSLAFNKRGQEVGRGISDDRNAPESTAVASCIRDRFPIGLTIPPPGVAMSFTLPMALP